jgi:hypothetical protein
MPVDIQEQLSLFARLKSFRVSNQLEQSLRGVDETFVFIYDVVDRNCTIVRFDSRSWGRNHLSNSLR